MGSADTPDPSDPNAPDLLRDGPLDGDLLVNTPGWFAIPRQVSEAADEIQAAKFLMVRRLLQIGRRWRNRLSYRLRALGSERTGWQSLFWLSLAGNTATQRELAERVGIKESTLARALDGLERQGLVTRAAVPGNRRANHVSLTAAAGPMLDRINVIAKDVRDELLGDIDPDDLATCLRVLAQINAAFDRTED